MKENRTTKQRKVERNRLFIPFPKSRFIFISIYAYPLGQSFRMFRFEIDSNTPQQRTRRTDWKQINETGIDFIWFGSIYYMGHLIGVPLNYVNVQMDPFSVE